MVTHPSVVPTFAQQYRDAVWGSDLRPEHRIVALCYADHDRQGVGTAWVTITRLMQRTGIRSRTTATRAVASLVTGGWLAKAGPLERHPQIMVYRFAIPATTTATQEPTPARARSANGRFITDDPAPAEPVQHVDRSVEGNRSSTWTGTGPADGPVAEGEPVQQMDRYRSTPWTGTGPRRGLDTQKDSQKDPQKGVTRVGARTPARGPDPDGQLALPIDRSQPPAPEPPIITGELVSADTPPDALTPASQHTAIEITRGFTRWAAGQGTHLARSVQAEYDTVITALIQDGIPAEAIVAALKWQVTAGKTVPRWLPGHIAQHVQAGPEAARVRQPAAPVANTTAKLAASEALRDPTKPRPKSIFDDMKEAS
jgi:hypothetical protein